MENHLSEIQSTSHELSKAIKKVESQLHDYKKSLENTFNDRSPDKTKASAESPSISEDSVAHIAFSLVSEQKEKEKH